MKKLRNLFKSTFFIDSSYMVFSTIAMQLIAILSLPFLTRLFTPEMFGFHATYRAALIIISILLTLKLETAIVLPKYSIEKNNIYISTIINAFFITIFLLVIYFLFKIFNLDLLAIVFGFSNYELLIYIVFGSLLVGITNSNINFLVSTKKFKTIAFSRLILPISFFLISVLFYFIFKNILALILSHLISYILLFFYLQKNTIIEIKDFNKKKYFSILNKYKDIIKYTSSNSLLNTLSVNVPSLLLLSLFGPQALGFYAIGAKIISMPTQFISSSFSQVFYKKSTDIYNTNSSELYPFVKKVMFILLSIGLVVFSFGYFVIPYIIPFFLGSDWNGAIEIMQYLCLWQALVIVNSPVSTLTILLKKQKYMLAIQVSLFISRILSLLLSYNFGFSIEKTILFFSLVSVLFNLILFVFYLIISKNSIYNNY